MFIYTKQLLETYDDFMRIPSHEKGGWFFRDNYNTTTLYLALHDKDAKHVIIRKLDINWSNLPPVTVCREFIGNIEYVLKITYEYTTGKFHCVIDKIKHPNAWEVDEIKNILEEHGWTIDYQ